ncbi:MAG TPA: M13 family peptidase [Elusimicrobia bacterium]|nr:M13 family peptidase [Elusimicrobiota bacterium]HBT61542.1 M13 family peptidase [Elusimicrobiota bacterium]
MDQHKREILLKDLSAAWGGDFRVETGEKSSHAGKHSAHRSPIAADKITSSLAASKTALADANRAYDGNASKGDVSGGVLAKNKSSVKPASAASESVAKSAYFESPQALQCVDPSIIDKSVNPCADFYQYACGNWLKKTNIPPDQARWGRFNELADNNRLILRDILEKASKSLSKNLEANRQKIGDFYAACMDEKTAEAKGIAPLQSQLSRIRSLKNKSELATELAYFHSIGVYAFFGFGPTQDYQDATRMVAAVDQGGISLPDRDYYLDRKFGEELGAYGRHVAKMFELAGETSSQAAAHASSVLRIETALAQASMDRVKRREPSNVHHKTFLKELQAWTPSFNWDNYFSAAGAPRIETLDVVDPGFFKGMDNVLAAASLEEVKVYLRWKLLNDKAHILSSKFVSENFDFFGKTLTGAKQDKPRWKRCVDLVDGYLGEALGKEYVKRTGGEKSKERTLEMIHAIEKTMADTIRSLDWMSEETKQEALKKLAAITNKIGYPDQWRDYQKLSIAPGDLVGNDLRATSFEVQRQMSQINQPVDRGEWYMSPPTVNAYYDPQMNNINFPAGILQPPFFDANADDAANFGGLGGVIAHELTHAFDDEGSKYGADGNLKNWWSEGDRTAFESRAQGFVGQYSKYVAYKDPTDEAKNIKINGELTLGENVADNGGLRLAYLALKSQAGKNSSPIDGFTPQQRVFLSWGQIWCSKMRDELAKVRAKTDPHSPPMYRVNGVVLNMPEFKEAFSCPEHSPMTATKPVRVW